MTRAQIIALGVLASSFVAIWTAAEKLWVFAEPAIAQQIESVAQKKFETLDQRLRSIETSQQAFAEEKGRVDERLKAQSELLKEQRNLTALILFELRRGQ